jgi:hypothetical protein
MDQVEKEKSKNTRKEAKTYAQQIQDIINILNSAFKDFPDPEQGEEELENFMPRLGKVLKKLDCIEPQLHSSKTSTDILEELITALNVFRIHLKTARDHLKLFDLSELVLKVENTFISRVVYIIKTVETRIDFQDHRDWLVTESERKKIKLI